MKDVFGKALLDYFNGEFEAPLLLNNEYGDPEIIPLESYFNTADEFSDMEYFALSRAKGRILDIGAATGRHAWYLQQQKKKVTALDLSPKCGQIMKASGVNNVLIGDIFQLDPEPFDTIIMLMNGVGLVGSVAGLRRFLGRMKSFVKPNGQLIFDSTDITYLYRDTALPMDKYYGQLSFRYEYKGEIDESFDWLYIDHSMLTKVSKEEGWMCQVIYEDGQDSYLARLIQI
jgi:SAM-dependent methyltransferase